MSLVRLLTAGKSLVGLNDDEGRYRLTRKSLLPSFPATKNPFRATTVPSPACAPEPAPAAQLPAGEEPAQERMVHQDEPDASPAKPRESAFKRIRDLWFRAGSRSRPDSKAIEPRQTELSLDQVKVVRNDLSEYDNEPAVPVGGRVSKPVTNRATSKPSPKLEPELGASFLAEKKL